MNRKRANQLSPYTLRCRHCDGLIGVGDCKFQSDEKGWLNFSCPKCQGELKLKASLKDNQL